MVTPLTSAQQSAVTEIVAAGRLAQVAPDPVRALTFMRQASDVLADLPYLTKPQNRYNLAYDACHDIGEAMLATYGYRTLSGPGQHEAIGRFLRAVIDGPPGDRDARRFEQLRRSRNQQRYDAQPVGTADADLAAETAIRLFAAAVKRGVPND